MNFKVGDRVRCIEDYEVVLAGMEGKIVDIVDIEDIVLRAPIAVSWDKGNEWFHTCIERTEDEHGYWVPEENIQRISKPEENIQRISKKEVSMVPIKGAKFAVVWEEENRDPIKYFKARPEAEKWIAELLNVSVEKDSIWLLSIGKKYHVEIQYGFEEK